MARLGTQRAPEMNDFNLHETLENILDESERQFSCLICSDIFRSPVTITCGHTFCKGCIEDWFLTKETCPCCRQPCLEGISEPVHVFEEYLKRTKPLIQKRMAVIAEKEEVENERRKLVNKNSRMTGSYGVPGINVRRASIFEEQERVQRERNIAKFMTSRLSSVRNSGDRLRLEASLLLLRTMISSGQPLKKLKHDLETLDMKYLIRKYYKKKESMFGQSLHEHEYIPQARVKQYSFVIPSAGDSLWILGMFVCTVALYLLFSEVGSTDYEELQQSLLRILGVLSFYLSTFEELYEHGGL